MLLLPWPARINEPDGHAKQLAGDVATLANGEAFVVWGDSRRSNGDVWARAVNADGQMAWLTAFQVNDLDDEDDWRPQTAVNANSQALVIWNHDNKNGLDGQLLDASGVPLWAGDQRLNVDTRKASFGTVLALPDNSFLVAWPGQRQPDDNHWDLFLQRISAEGERLWPADRRLNAGDYLIYDIQVDARNRPALALDVQGHVIVTWRGDTGSGTDIYVRRFTVNGVPLWGQEVALGAHLNVRLPADRFNHTVGAANEILVAWAASNDGASGIRLQRLNLNGQLLGASVWATSATGEIPYSSPDLVRLPDGDWILAWDDEHSMGSNVYAHRLSPTGGARWSAAIDAQSSGSGRYGRP
ncbi:MAG: hypothetical protein IPO15_22120 [Anaerolineae bacterium]|uniref:hypothetical protein n=1 Tax=Candidatus Amarolinea dominans TaxID=3140696 RepID=UPI00313762F2|nr:hypothetical protein [Anaerolineae bacterium]